MHFVMHHVMVRGHAICDANGGEVGVNIVLPKSEAREDVRRHVHGVRGRRRDAGVFARGRKREAGHGGIVATVDDVVSDAGMIRLLVVKFVEDGNGGFGVGEIGVAVGARGEEREGVKDGGFVVVGIAFVDALHGFGVSVGALIVVEFVGVGVKDGERQDVVAFAGGRWVKRASFGEELGALGEVGFAGAIPELVVKGHCLSPVGHGAARIFFGDFRELGVGYFVLEGIQKGNAALELRLDCGSAGGGEGDGAEFFVGVMVLRLLRRGW